MTVHSLAAFCLSIRTDRSFRRRLIVGATGVAFTLTGLTALHAAEYPRDGSLLVRATTTQGTLGISTTATKDVTWRGQSFVSLQIERLLPGSSLDGAPVSIGDRIVAVNDRLFQNKADFVDTIRALRPGSNANIEYIERATGIRRQVVATVTSIDALNTAARTSSRTNLPSADMASRTAPMDPRYEAGERNIQKAPPARQTQNDAAMEAFLGMAIDVLRSDDSGGEERCSSNTWQSDRTCWSGEMLTRQADGYFNR